MRYAGRFSIIWILLLAGPVLKGQGLETLIDQAPNSEAFWSVSVMDSQGEMIESFHSDKLIIPASNQKLFTLAAVLDHFGKDYQFSTPVYGRGELQEGNWKGDLIIRGSGDPSISGTLYGGERYYVFESLVDQLKENGIQQISGNLIAEVSLFDEQYYPKGWDWYDLSFYYGVQISPLSFNNNAVDLEVFAEGEVGSTPRISWFPEQTDYVKFINRQVISHPATEYDEYYRREAGENIIVLGSTLPKGYYEKESLSIDNPPLFFLHSFRNYLESNGIQFNGDLKVLHKSVDPGDLVLLAEHQAKKLSEIISWTNRESDNFYTEMLLKSLSAYTQDETRPGSFQDGIRKVKTFLAKAGLDTSYVIMNDGSGMAAGNFTSTAQIAEILHFMKAHPEYRVYRNSFPVAGQSGTLAYRMKGTDLSGNLWAKTGFVSGNRTLAGYLKTKSGQNLVVSIATNHFAGKVYPADRTQEAILQYLYEKY